MRPKNRILAILRSKSGVSLMFVLGIMLLLLAIGASVMTAASANIGANVRQNQYNRAVLVGNSIHRNIKHSLKIEQGSGDDFENSLAFQIADAIYKASLPTGSLTEKIEIELNLAVGAAPIDANHSVILEIFPHEVDVRFAGPVGSIGETDPPTPRVPRTASVHARMTVTVVVEVETGIVVRDENRTITTQATYELNALMSDINVVAIDEQDSTVFDDNDLELVESDEFGWELINLEIIESVVEQ